MLKIKGSPRQLESGEFEEVWPGDESVDLSASNLLEWAIHGRKRGLQFVSGKDPAIIRCRPLVEREVSRIVDLYRAGDPNVSAEAFRYGCIHVPGVTLIRERDRGVVQLTDETVDFLAQETVVMPFVPALRAAYNLDQEKDEEATDLDTALPWAIGAHILAATFRNR
jgi:hypothetical protein